MPLIKSLITKRSIVIASATVMIGLVAAAVYLKRKRQKDYPSKKNVKRDREKRSGARHSLSTSNSYANSCASSADCSTTSSYRRRNMLVANPQDYITLEKLYKEGVVSFEDAVRKWEKATSLLQTPSRPTDSTDPILSISEQHILENNSDSQKLRTRFHSASDLHTIGDSSSPLPSPLKIAKRKKRLHSSSVGDLSDMLKDVTVEKDNAYSALQEQLQTIVTKARHLQDTIDYVLYDENTTDSDTDMTVVDLGEYLSDGSGSESSSSYFSTKEFWDTRSIDSGSRRLVMYEEALAAVERGEIACRTSRATLLNCFSEDEFLAKLHCLRQGLEAMLQDLTVRNWLIESGRSMIECILCIAGQNIEDFQDSFSKMLDYVNTDSNWKDIESELKGRKVVKMTFYDIVLDFLLMDAFDDLANPPGPVLSIMQNKWLASSLKESALYTAVWSVLKAKRARLQYANGFVAHLYDISSHVTPVLAWGFMGPDGKLKDICEYFKKEVMDFLRGLFSFDQIRYTTRAQMADDILRLCRKRFETVTTYLQNSISPI